MKDVKYLMTYLNDSVHHDTKMDWSNQMEWQGNWIWDSNTVGGKNDWFCFRKTITFEEEYEKAVISLTADSRYYLYVNENLLGYGPFRSWPWELSYDS